MSARDIAVVINNSNETISPWETIDTIKQCGYQKVFIQWYHKDWHPNQEQQLAYIKTLGLKVIFAHLGYEQINQIWVEGAKGDALVERYKKDIEVCKDNDISMVVMHLTSKTVAPPYGEIGLNRIKKIVDHAKTLGVKVAFENTKIKGYLEYVMKHIDNDNIGICFDSGHYHAHFHDDWDLLPFQNRIFCVHLHDNDESDDQHLIPFDGTLDWRQIVSMLKACGYQGEITLELCYRNEYLHMSLQRFYQKGYAAGEKLAAMFGE